MMEFESERLHHKAKKEFSKCQGITPKTSICAQKIDNFTEEISNENRHEESQSKTNYLQRKFMQ